MNNLLKSLCFLIFIPLALISCGESVEDEPSQLQVSLSEIASESAGGSQSVAVSGNITWTVTLNSEWVRVTPAQGEGDGQITFSIDPNPAAAARNLEARVVGGGVVRTIQISQAAFVPEFPAYHIPADATDMRDISSLALAKEMGVGWNLGNSLEAMGGETAWGNPKVTKAFIDQVKAAGFNAVRIPVAWSKFSNASDFTIDQAWMNRVQEVVDYAIDNGMYVLLNNHWDEGWMQPTFAKQDYVNDRLEKMWIQIALHFRDYDDHLLFAGTNEVMVDGDYGAPKPEYSQVQNSFNQTFVDAVRSTGGRNAYRNLVVQTFNTNIDYGISFFEMPDDSAADRLMVEVHYYDPYEFALQGDEKVTQWGKDATDPSKTAAWGGESHADGQFQKMKANFIDEGIAVLLGEYGAVDKKAEDNGAYREYYLLYITQSAKTHGLVPFYWDNGHGGDYGFALFDRADGEQIYPGLIRAIVEE
ncbi:cellulase family glycosylhydrolase [Algoriphagus terrigena]|uniref:cellulase family glycosylhydrolase n=1 Tax=Algoriphagus terrigena TaxID=344884 RepID=UPI00047CFF21|nr:cellulase family glycosylhydrolase [Algoriphagus terrigena]